MLNKEILMNLMSKKNLSMDDMRKTINIFVNEGFEESELAAILVGLAMKGESSEEVLGIINGINDSINKIHYPIAVADVCGTGGDGLNTFNISTLSSLILASGGIKIAKHGNRAISSECGSADVLEELGVNIMADENEAVKILDEVGIVFLFAPLYHKALGKFKKVRQDLRVRTILNLVGPFVNPFTLSDQLIGVSNIKLGKDLAVILKELGIKRGAVVSSTEGMDEISLTSITNIYEIKGASIKSYELDPRVYGFKLCEIKELKGGDKKYNAKLILGILSGVINGPKREIAVLNAGFSFYLFERTSSISEGIMLANKLIDEGLALKKLEELIKVSNKGIRCF
ncbi:MAG: anthranilate phosphoribosyltransferase [Sarcina sp.]